jgi:hypothetical protein
MKTMWRKICRKGQGVHQEGVEQEGVEQEGVEQEGVHPHPRRRTTQMDLRRVM